MAKCLIKPILFHTVKYEKYEFVCVNNDAINLFSAFITEKNYIIKNCKIGINVRTADDTINWFVIA